MSIPLRDWFATCPIYLIDPADVAWTAMRPYTHIKKGASAGMEELFDKLKVHC